jgi:hypothetical protein
MRFLIMPRAASNDPKASEPAPFDEAVFKAFMKYNEDMHRAGVLLASEGLSAASKGAHVLLESGKKRRVVDGPFAETKELVGGFYMIEVASREEAIEWALRYPGGFGGDDVLEIRPLTGLEDLPPELLAMIVEAAPGWSASVMTRRKA